MERPIRHRASLAVLPFENLSAEGSVAADYFSRGFVDDVITDLSRFPELLVLSSHSSQRVEAKQLDVDYVLTGNLRRDPKQLRISAQLLNHREGTVVWGERFDAELDELFALQDRIASRVVDCVRSARCCPRAEPS